MTDSGTGPTSGDKPRWLRDVQEAMERANSAFQAAWEATREERASALESAKNAARELGEVFDEGISAARENWGPGSPGEPPTEEE